MPSRLVLLSKGEKKEIARILFKSLGVGSRGYKLIGKKTPFARDPNIYGNTVTLTTDDGFYLIVHYPMKRLNGKDFVITEDGLIPVGDGGVSVAVNKTFEIKENKRALKSLRKAHLKVKREYAPSSGVVAVATFTTFKPVALTVAIGRKKSGRELPPDILYSVKDRVSIEDAGIVIGMGTKEILSDVKNFQRLTRDAITLHKNLQTVYKLRFINYGDELTKRALRLLKAFRDPLLNELAENFAVAMPSIAEKRGYLITPPVALDFSFNIPIGSTKGGFDVAVLDLKTRKEINFTIPNPNPNGRKKFISMKSLLFYNPANKFIKHRLSRSAKKPVVDVLSFEHLLV